MKKPTKRMENYKRYRMLAIRKEYNLLYLNGVSINDIVDKMADKHHVCVSTVRNDLRKTK
jgi:uncharacterized protein YlbG (UPF0298 family)